MLIIEEWPNVRLGLKYTGKWLTAILNIYLPSMLCFGIAIFAQFKRRKIQVFVTLTSIICVIIIVSIGPAFKRFMYIKFLQHTSCQSIKANWQNRSITLQDLWLSLILVHLFCILSADLLLPACRIVFSTSNYDSLQKENSLFMFFIKESKYELGSRNFLQLINLNHKSPFRL